MAEYPKQYLTASSFTPAVFQPQVFTPKQEDISLLATSLNKLEEREEKLGAQKLAIAEAFSNARDLLPDNDETNRYITENQERITSTIDAMVNLGDMSGALDASKNLAAKFVSSPEFKARTETHKQRNQWIEELKSSGANQDVIDLYKHKYKDVPTFTYNDRGEVNGSETWDAPLPSKAVNPFEIIQAAVRSIAPEKTNTSFSGPKGGSSRQTEKITAESISEQSIDMIMKNDAWYSSIEDQLEAGLYKISKLKERLAKETNPVQIEKITNNIKELEAQYTMNGIEFSSTKAYIDYVFGSNTDMVKKAAYDYNFTSSRVGAEGGGGSGSGIVTNPMAMLPFNYSAASEPDAGHNIKTSSLGTTIAFKGYGGNYGSDSRSTLIPKNSSKKISTKGGKFVIE